MIERTEIRKKIPYGYGKQIAQKAGVSERFVSKYWNDETVNSERVEKAALEVLEEIKKSKIEFNTRLQAALS